MPPRQWRCAKTQTTRWGPASAGPTSGARLGPGVVREAVVGSRRCRGCGSADAFSTPPPRQVRVAACQQLGALARCLGEDRARRQLLEELTQLLEDEEVQVRWRHGLGAGRVPPSDA
jgi:hypothetical protein